MANVSSQPARFGSGKSVRRVEDEALLTGKGRFADDVGAPGEAHLAFVRSPHPHARIVAIDTAAAAFSKAAHVVRLDLVNQRVAPCPIEPRATLATYDAATGRLTLTVSCQTPTGLRDELAETVLGIPKEKVRVLVGDVGGGFGMKTNLYPEDVVAAFCARKLVRP